VPLARDLAGRRAAGQRPDLDDAAGAAADVGHPAIRQPAAPKQQIERHATSAR